MSFNEGDISFNGESDNWQLAAAQKVSKMFEEVASGSGEVSFPRKILHSRWLL